MNQHRTQQKDSALPFVERLCSIASRLAAIADTIAENEPVVQEDAAQPNHEPSSVDAIKVRNERLRLVDAWAALESEQREHALQQATLPPKPIASQTDEKPATLKSTTNPLDRATQFRLLQRECDRPRN